MSTTTKEVLGIDATRFAVLLSAYKECTSEVQSIVDEMAAIVASDDTDADEKQHALDVLVEALFPSFSVDVCEYDATKNASTEARAARSAIEEEEAAFSEKVQSLMKSRGLTQAELAAKTGVGQPAISNILNRRSRPQRRTIVRLADALGVDPAELWPV